MSSILDALRKLEEEKAAAQAPDIAINDDEAERDLMGGRAWSSQVPLKLTPAALAVGGLVVVVLVLSASIGTAIVLTRGNAPAAVASTPAALPEAERTVASVATIEPDLPATLTETSDVTTQPGSLETAPPQPPPREVTAEPVEESTRPAQAAPRIERRSEPPVEIAMQLTEKTPTGPSTVTQQPLNDPLASTAEEAPGPVTPPEPVNEEREPAPVEESQPAPVQESQPAPAPVAPTFEPAPAQPETTMAMPDDIRLLPPLTPMLQSQYKLDGKDLNMTRPKDANHPVGSAVIDLVPTWEGEAIRGTNARVVAVERHGIAIEIIGTSDRYYWRFR